MKTIRNIFIILAIFLLFYYIFSQSKIYPTNELSYGITFSKKQAASLGQDWQASFLIILDELKVKKIRLAAYWDEVEQTKDNFNWQDIDWQLNEAKKRNVEVILAVGARLPRWPECHYPDWAKTQNSTDKEAELLDYIKNTINRYQDREEIKAWQIENEPFLPYFGECPQPDKNLLDKEISLARSLDDRPMVVTDSGELSVWFLAARRADIFGTTMYRDTYSAKLKRYIHYPITPRFFIFKKNLAKLFASPKKWIVIELQSEPWGPIPYQNLSKEDRNRTMNPQKFKEILEFARQAGFQEFYLWGAEWWLWERDTQKDPEMWDMAKLLFNSN